MAILDQQNNGLFQNLIDQLGGVLGNAPGNIAEPESLETVLANPASPFSPAAPNMENTFTESGISPQEAVNLIPPDSPLAFLLPTLGGGIPPLVPSGTSPPAPLSPGPTAGGEFITTINNSLNAGRGEFLDQPKIFPVAPRNLPTSQQILERNVEPRFQDQFDTFRGILDAKSSAQ